MCDSTDLQDLQRLYLWSPTSGVYWVLMIRVLWGENVYHCFYIRNLESLSYLCFLVLWWKGHIFQDELKHYLFLQAFCEPLRSLSASPLFGEPQHTFHLWVLMSEYSILMNAFNTRCFLRSLLCVRNVYKCWGYNSVNSQQRGTSSSSSSLIECVCMCVLGMPDKNK